MVVSSKCFAPRGAVPDLGQATRMPGPDAGDMARRYAGYHPVTLRRVVDRAEVPMDATNQLLVDHANFMSAMLLEGGGPAIDLGPHIQAFWDGFEAYLPPRGSFYLVRDRQDALLGTGALVQSAPGVGEMKHLHVRPWARGLGLGRRLVEARMADARAMGLRSLVAETFSACTEMRALYARFGFEEVARDDVGQTACKELNPDMSAYFVTLRRRI